MRYGFTKGRRAVLALGVVALLGGACTDLTEIPPTEITAGNFNPGPRDIAALLAPAYVPVRDMWMMWYGALDFQEEVADAFLTPVRPNGWWDGGTYYSLHQHRWTPTQGQPNSMWSRSWNGINTANRVYYQIESGVAPISDATYKTQVLAELRAVRAYYYSLLLDNFGNVPIVTDFLSTELPTTKTRQEVFNFVVSELEAVTPNLSTAAGASVYGRLNQWAAKALLARVYLNAPVYVGQNHYDKVLSLTQQIIDSGLYQLEANYRAPFARNNHTSMEVLWHAPYDAINAPGSNFHMKTLKMDLRFVFNMQAQPWGGSSSSPQHIDTYQQNDKRLAATWLMGPHFDGQGRGYDFVKHVPSYLSTQSHHGYPVWKYEIYPQMTGSSDVDYPVIRYAEVLFMRAEALLRTGNAAGAAQLVTQVRQRAFDDPAQATVTGADLVAGSSYNYGWYDTDGVVKTAAGGTPTTNGGADIQFGRFLDELGWEFAAEGHRRQHLIRFGVFTTKTWFNRVPNGDHRTIFAIPQGAMNTNPNLVQNPGY
jgi:starch-binding outer membrane protein, SusD/RagB family